MIWLDRLLGRAPLVNRGRNYGHQRIVPGARRPPVSTEAPKPAPRGPGWTPGAHLPERPDRMPPPAVPGVAIRDTVPVVLVPQMPNEPATPAAAPEWPVTVCRSACTALGQHTGDTGCAYHRWAPSLMPPIRRGMAATAQVELVAWAQFDGDEWHDFRWADSAQRRAFQLGRRGPGVLSGQVYYPLTTYTPEPGGHDG